jgi:hypothetical protein
MPEDKKPEHGFDGDYARDTHRGGLSDNYARDGGWSGAGRADDYIREEHPDPLDAEPEADTEVPSIGKARE